MERGKLNYCAVLLLLLIIGNCQYVFSQKSIEKELFYNTIDVTVNPAFLIAEKTSNGQTRTLNNNMYQYGVRWAMIFNGESKCDYGIFASVSGYSSRSQQNSVAPAMAAIKFGFTTNMSLHAKGNHRIFWGQDFGAVYGNFNYDVTDLTGLPESRWGINVEEAVRYNYILSSGCGLGFKCFLDVSAFVGKSDEPMLYKPDVLTELGVAFSISF